LAVRLRYVTRYVSAHLRDVSTRCELAEPCCSGAGSQPILSHLSDLSQQR